MSSLKSIYIEKLFGLYTYTLDMKPRGDDVIRFITGPNGYGKTTILNILNDLSLWDLKSLSVIPFYTLQLTFDDDNIVNIQQSRSPEKCDNEDTDVIKALMNVELEMTLCRSDIGNVVCSFQWKYDDEITGEGNDICLYLKSHPIYYIKDQRLKSDKSPSSVNENATKMREKLNEHQVRINEALYIDAIPSTAYISEEEYYVAKEKFKEDLETIQFCNILKNSPLPDYSNASAGYLEVVVRKVSECLEKERDFIDSLKCFRRIIGNSDFANKHLQISPQYGYRFLLGDENKTIILPENLSSGEQHILIMAFDLLFDAGRYSLILIDEPELSFHPAWQLDFLNNLLDIIALRQSQCIVSTHSPQVFRNDFNLAVDLYKQSISTIPD